MIIYLIFADMKRMKQHLALAASVLLFSAFSGTCLTSCSDDLPTPGEKLTGNTVIVYMGAENSLSYFSQSDLNEMKAALGDIPEDCQVVVYQDAELKPVIFHLTTNSISTWYEYTEDHNSADMNIVKSVLNRIIRDFPSEKYSLVLWSHGTGWIDQPNRPQRSIIIDNGHNTQSDMGQWLHIGQLASILSGMPHMEYIFFDACYMQSVEVASYLYPYADYIIGSPTETPSTGAPYDRIMKALCKADIRAIIDGHAEEYTGSLGVLLSAVHTAEFRNLCTVTSQFIPGAFPRTDMPSTDGIQIYAPEYGQGNVYMQDAMPVPYDIRSAMYHTLSAEDYAVWEEAWKKAILHPIKSKAWESAYPTIRYGKAHCTLTDAEHYGGISMNIPRREYREQGWEEQFRLSPWYTFTLWEETGW